MNAPSSPLVPLTVGLLASLFAIACTSVNGDEPASPSPTEGAAEGAGQSEDEIRASCTNPRSYYATLTEPGARCEAIAARRGQWIPEPLFKDAPADVQISTCAYAWKGEKYSRPDRDAIYGELGYSNGLTPSCGASSAPEIGALTPIPYVEDWTQAGSVGCDVCGILKRGNVWVILPPDRSFRKQLQVQLSNGDTRAFQIQPTDARALMIQLPAAPRGTSYKEGRVKIL